MINTFFVFLVSQSLYPLKLVRADGTFIFSKDVTHY